MAAEAIESVARSSNGASASGNGAVPVSGSENGAGQPAEERAASAA